MEPSSPTLSPSSKKPSFKNRISIKGGKRPSALESPISPSPKSNSLNRRHSALEITPILLVSKEEQGRAEGAGKENAVSNQDDQQPSTSNSNSNTNSNQHHSFLSHLSRKRSSNTTSQ